MRDVRDLHEQITKEVRKERTDEVASFLAQKRAAREVAERRETAGLRMLKEMKVDVAKLEGLEADLDAEREKELEEIRKRYIGDAAEATRIEPALFRAAALDAAYLPIANVASLPPSYAEIFSTKDPEDKLSGGTGTEVYNYACFDAWDWAKGAGSGNFGSGAGSYQVWVEWGFWYWVPSTKYFGITTHNVFRGFYIVKADDGIFTSKFARAKVSIWNNVWQYNWKGWNSIDVLNVADDNINVNARFDTDRHAYYTALLGGGDWAYVRNVVGLYVYARGSGSYAELNFATGAANYLCSPHVHVS